jgi:hypothetical protein
MNVPKLAGEEDLETKIRAQIQALENEGCSQPGSRSDELLA